MSGRLTGKLALVTGAAQVLGASDGDGGRSLMERGHFRRKD
jgi:hypothetical protein